MNVRVDKSRGDEGALQVDDLGRLAGARTDRLGADRGDAVALDPDRVAEGRRPGTGPDATFDISGVERIAALGEGGTRDRRRGGAAREGEERAAADHHLVAADLRGGFSLRHLSSRASQVAADSGP